MLFKANRPVGLHDSVTIVRFIIQLVMWIAHTVPICYP